MPIIESRIEPSPREAEEAAELVEACNRADGTVGEVAFDASLHAYREMQSCYFAREGGALVGLLVLFAPREREAEVSAWTRPSFRGRRVFSGLLEAAREELRRFGYERLLFVCERGSAAGRSVVERLGGELAHSEYELHLPEGVTAPDPGPGTAEIAEVGQDRLEEAVELAVEVFGDGRGNASTMVTASVNEADRSQLLLSSEGKAVGMCALHRLGASVAIHGLGILPALRGRGWGRILLAAAVGRARSGGGKDIWLEVDSVNATAFSLYRSFGFEERRCVDYFSKAL